MNFTPDMLAKVLDGTKTQTRRPVKDFDRGYKFGALEKAIGVFPDRGQVYYEYVANHKPGTNGHLRYQVGSTYAVAPGRGKKSIARIRLLYIRKELPLNISEEDAIAEGFDSREAFFDKLRSLYGASVDLTAPYWAITFELVRS